MPKGRPRDPRPGESPFLVPPRAAALTGVEGVGSGCASVSPVTAVDGEPRPDDETQHCGEVGVQLARPFGGTVGHPCGFGEVSAPNPVQDNLKVDEDQFTFLALLDATVLDCA